MIRHYRTILSLLALVIGQISAGSIFAQNHSTATNLEDLLVRIATRHDCVFTIEKARESSTRPYSLSALNVAKLSDLVVRDSLDKDLKRLRRIVPFFSYQVDKRNSKIVHVIDSRLLLLDDYALEKTLASFVFKGRIYELPNMIGRQGIRIGTQTAGDVRNLLVKDFSTLADYQASDRTVREILSEPLKLSERGRLLWIGESDLEKDGFTGVWYLAGPKKLSRVDASNADVKLKIALAKNEFSKGDSILLNLTTENNLDDKIDLSFESYDHFGGFDVTILDANGSIVEPKKDPRAVVMIARTNYWEISPRSKDDRGILTLDRFYDLAPGKYRVKVSRTVSIVGKPQKLFTESDYLEFAVATR